MLERCRIMSVSQHLSSIEPSSHRCTEPTVAHSAALSMNWSCGTSTVFNTSWIIHTCLCISTGISTTLSGRLAQLFLHVRRLVVCCRCAVVDVVGRQVGHLSADVVSDLSILVGPCCCPRLSKLPPRASHSFQWVRRSLQTSATRGHSLVSPLSMSN